MAPRRIGRASGLRSLCGAKQAVIFLFNNVDLLEEELRAPSPQSPEEMRHALSEIKTQLARLDDLLQDYLSLARVATIERTPQDLGTAVQAWAQEWQDRIAGRGVRLQLVRLADLGHAVFHRRHAPPCAAQPGAECLGCHAPGRHPHPGGSAGGNTGAAAHPGYGERDVC